MSICKFRCTTQRYTLLSCQSLHNVLFKHVSPNIIITTIFKILALTCALTLVDVTKESKAQDKKFSTYEETRRRREGQECFSSTSKKKGTQAITGEIRESSNGEKTRVWSSQGSPSDGQVPRPPSQSYNCDQQRNNGSLPPPLVILNR